MEHLLADGVKFDAVFTGDDESAIGVLLALRQAGRKVPEEVAIVGFDDSLFANTLLPPLTTVRAPTEQVGKAGCTTACPYHPGRGRGTTPGPIH